MILLIRQCRLPHLHALLFTFGVLEDCFRELFLAYDDELVSFIAVKVVKRLGDARKVLIEQPCPGVKPSHHEILAVHVNIIMVQSQHSSILYN